MGPDLTTVTSDKNRGIAYARGVMLNGGNRMPNYHLPEKDVDMLIAYLSYVNITQTR